MKLFNPDVIFIQHEYGLFPSVARWNTLMSQLSRWRTITVLHTVLEHRVADQETHLDYKSRAIAEAACPEVIVHSRQARDCLRDRGYSGLIHYIPHGCFPPALDAKLPVNKYGGYSNNTVFQYGFGGEHKGWETAIEVIGLLKPKYPDILYTGLFNLSMHGAEHQIAYHKHLLNLVEIKGLQSNVAIHRGFQSEAMVRNFLRSSRVAIFPYKVPNRNWCSWGASGAVQLPFSYGLPVVLSKYPAFLEFENLCEDAIQMADRIDQIFKDPAFEQKEIEYSLRISESRSWDKIASWYLSCKSTEEFTSEA
jgi:glycosyltransferase involved in cell wall biosynthesis